ncbi:hypothetical protein DFH27DRAFT_154674 [Peziza echinospora]|nr:hypothetical protein DFH27DRAFT_154674 [Peziza echinospora]
MHYPIARGRAGRRQSSLTCLERSLELQRPLPYCPAMHHHHHRSSRYHPPPLPIFLPACFACFLLACQPPQSRSMFCVRYAASSRCGALRGRKLHACSHSLCSESLAAAEPTPKRPPQITPCNWEAGCPAPPPASCPFSSSSPSAANQLQPWRGTRARYDTVCMGSGESLLLNIIQLRLIEWHCSLKGYLRPPSAPYATKQIYVKQYASHVLAPKHKSKAPVGVIL